MIAKFKDKKEISDEIDDILFKLETIAKDLIEIRELFYKEGKERCKKKRRKKTS